MASPVSDSYSGKKNASIIGGKLLRRSVIASNLTQLNQVSAASFAVIASSHQVTVANVSQANYASPAALLAPTIPAGEWQQLTIAPHGRKVIGESIAISGTFDPTFAQSVDARSVQSVSAIPYKSFGMLIPGEPGIVYYAGSLHSNYPGNEIDKINLSNLTGTQVTTTLSHQPKVPPNGPASGYGSGSSGYVFAQYDTPLADSSLWQPYAHHTWTKNSWHPVWGSVFQVVGAQGDGATVGANPAGSGSSYQQGSQGQALVSYDFTEGKYHLRVDTELFAPSGLYQPPGWSGASDWNQHRQSLIFLRNHGGITYVREVVNTTGTAVDLFNFDQAALGGTTWGWTDSTGGNGVLLRHLEGHKYLGMRADFNKAPADPVELNSYTTLFLLRLANTETPSHSVHKLTPPAGALVGINPHGDGNISFSVDRNSRRVFWVVFENNPTVGAAQLMRFYVSSFDDLMNWVEISTSGFGPVVHTDVQAGWLASCRQPIIFYNGHLFMIPPGQGTDTANPGYTNGAVKLWRVKVDSGELLPAFNFQRLDYLTQAPATGGFRFSYAGAPLQLIGTKHVNWAFRPTDGRYYQHAGDFGMSTCHSMAHLSLDGTARGYTFAEILDETTNAPSGKIRPSCVDDGYWFYIPKTSQWVAGRGKFVFRRGGDGEPMFFNGALKAKYGSADTNGTIAQLTQAISDGWSLPDKLYLFDPDTRTFEALGPMYSLDTSACTPPSAIGATFPVSNFNGWTQDNGSTYWPSVWTASSSSCRNGAFDPITGCLWSFYVNGGLAKFDLINKTVTMFNCSSWISDETGRTIFLDGSSPGANAVIADGSKPLFCYQDPVDGNRYKTYGAFHWEHKATWIDPETGYLYVVSPGTGYLWRFDTRATPTNTDGYKIPFGPVSKRIPFVGTYPALNSLTAWPPEPYAGNDRVQMNALLLPYKGGLLYLSPNLHDSGTSGEPRYAFWRRLGYAGDWSVVTMPQEFAANAGAAREPYSIHNAELMLISQAWTDNPDRQNYRYFWRVTDPAQLANQVSTARGVVLGDSITAWNAPAILFANGITGGKLQPVANCGVASNAIADVLARVDNSWNAAQPGLAGLSPLGWVALRIGTNNARGGATMSAQNKSDFDALIAKVLGYSEVCFVFAIPPVNASGVQDVASFNAYYQAKCAANPTRLIWVDDCINLRDPSGYWISTYRPSDDIHPESHALHQMAVDACEYLSPYLQGLRLASPLVTAADQVYPTVNQTWPNPTMAGSGGSNAIGSGGMPTNLTLTLEGVPFVVNSAIVAADALDANQTPWLKLTPTTLAFGGGASFIVQAARVGSSVTGGAPTAIDFAVELRFEDFDRTALEYVLFRSYGNNNEELVPAAPFYLKGSGRLTGTYVYRCALQRGASAQAHSSVLHQIRFRSAKAVSGGGLGSIYLRCISVKE